jgi:hypothetical protein
VGLPEGLPYLPIDEQFNETKTVGFLGDELSAGLAQVPSVIGSFVHDDLQQNEFDSLSAVDKMFTEVKGG